MRQSEALEPYSATQSHRSKEQPRTRSRRQLQRIIAAASILLLLTTGDPAEIHAAAPVLIRRLSSPDSASICSAMTSGSF